MSSQTKITKSVSSGTYDAEESGSGAQSPFSVGAMYMNSSDLELVSDMEPEATGAQKVGLRFSGINYSTRGHNYQCISGFQVHGRGCTQYKQWNNRPDHKGQNTDNTLTFSNTDLNFQISYLTDKTLPIQSPSEHESPIKGITAFDQ